MSHLHSVYDNDTHFKIDPVTRKIKNESGKVILMQNDHNSERFTFEIPRYVDGHDMSKCNKVEVHFINLKDDKTARNSDVYPVKDLQISPDSEDIVICSWLISQNATKYAGSLNFVLRYACLTDGVIDYQWYTDIHKGITVSESISNTKTVAIEYSDVLEQWRQELFDASEEGVNNITTARTQAIAAINTKKAEALQEIASKTVTAAAIVKTASGDVIAVSDSSDLELAGLKVYGKTTQNGTPTPEAPVALESVGESVNVTVCGKNLLKPMSSYTQNGITYTANADGSVSVRGTASDTAYYITSLNFPVGTYIVNGAPPGSKIGEFDIYINAKDINTGASLGGSIARDADDAKHLQQFTINQYCKLECVLRVGKGKTVDTIFYPMIRPASIADATYEPYKEIQTLTISTPNGLPGIPVTSGGNYTDDSGQQWVCDEVDFEKGQYIQRIYCYTFTGQETINSFDSGKTLGMDIKLLGLPSCVVPNKASGSNVSPMLCTHEAVTTQNELKNGSGGIAVAVWNNTQYLYFSGTYYGDDNGLKTAMAEAYASGTPYVWMYALETPIVRELNEAEKTDYTALHTNYPNTTVINDRGAGMEVKYVADTKLYIDNKFAELANAMLNN